ncbi:MAG: hypothetical protein JSV44_04380, partial [Candidatus Zixiibacteriota bacterium]
MLLLMPVAGFGYGIEAGRSSGLGGAVLLTDPTASDLLTCPFARFPDRRLVLESGFIRRFELSDLDEIYVAGGYRLRRYSVMLGLSQLGRSDYYTERLLKGVVAAAVDPATIGIFISGKLVEFGNHASSFHAVSFGLTAGLEYSRYHFGFVADNINRPKIAANGSPDLRRLSFYLELEGPSRYSICGRLA